MRQTERLISKVQPRQTRRTNRDGLKFREEKVSPDSPSEEH
jgi:hypothetical protein